MELFQVRYFLALCDTLNFTRAAEKCNVSQPSLTRAIQNLEAEFGGPLFHRERQHTHLTDLGRLMCPYFEQVYAQAQAAKDAAKTFAKLDNISLRIGVMCTIGPAMLCDFIRGFRQRYPGVDVEFFDAAAGSLATLLLEGGLDIAVYGVPEPLEDRLQGQFLYTERFVVVVAPSHPFAQQDVVRGRELHEQPYVNRANCEIFSYASGILREMGICSRIVLRSDRDDWVQAMILSGLGFGFFPEYAVTMPGLIIRPLIEPEFSRDIQLVTVRGRPHSPAVGAFVRQARSYRWPGQLHSPATTAALVLAEADAEATGAPAPPTAVGAGN